MTQLRFKKQKTINKEKTFLVKARMKKVISVKNGFPNQNKQIDVFFQIRNRDHKLSAGVRSSSPYFSTEKKK